MREEATFLQGLAANVITEVIWSNLVGNPEDVHALHRLLLNLRMMCRSWKTLVVGHEQWRELQRRSYWTELQGIDTKRLVVSRMGCPMTPTLIGIGMMTIR